MACGKGRPVSIGGRYICFIYAFLALFLFSPMASSAAAPVLCSYGGPDTLGSVRLTSFMVSGSESLEINGAVTVFYTLQNHDSKQRTIVFTQYKGAFVGSFAPSGRREFGYSSQGHALGPGESLEVQAQVTFDEAGAWKLWPAFCYSVGEGEECSQDEWHACELFVEGQEDITGPDIVLMPRPPRPAFNESFTVRVSAFDQSGIGGIVVFVNGVGVRECASSPCDFTGISPVDGPEIGVSATDRFGNVARSGSVPLDFGLPSECRDSDGGDFPFAPGSTANETARIENGTFYLPETFFDTCVDENHIVEYHCDGDVVGNSTHECGACYEAPEMMVEGGESIPFMGDSCLCVDSDGGRNYFERGHTTRPREGVSEDACMGDRRLREHYCDGNGTPADERYDCEYYCAEGACGCPDSDGGLDYEERGTALYTYTDFCVEEGTRGRLNEYYASIEGGERGAFTCEIRNVTRICEGACGEGRCVSTCNDSIRNQGEADVDCGGPCPPCNTRCLTDTKYAPPDTPCTLNWPDDPFTIEHWREGEREYLCNANEVCHPGLDHIVEEAGHCCNPHAPLIDSALCRVARREASAVYDDELKAKRCRGIYIIRGLGRYALWMRDYFYPETCCSSWSLCPNLTLYGGECSDGRSIWNDGVGGLVCGDTSHDTTRELGWGSDADMSENTCRVHLRPAHASINVIQTGICRDYSLAVNTLLRKAGYAHDEVIGFCDGDHCYNLVKFPGSSKYNIVDTTGNNADYSLAGDPPTGHPYCRYFNRRNWCLGDEELTYFGEQCTGSERMAGGTPRTCGNQTYNGLPNYLCGSNDYGLTPIPEITDIKSCNASS